MTALRNAKDAVRTGAGVDVARRRPAGLGDVRVMTGLGDDLQTARVHLDGPPDRAGQRDPSCAFVPTITYLTGAAALAVAEQASCPLFRSDCSLNHATSTRTLRTPLGRLSPLAQTTRLADAAESS